MKWSSHPRPRGRPPHPDILTPAEWRVVEQIREGRSNAEIAQHLGVSVNTVRTHVSRILDKVGVADRHALAAWQGEPAITTGRDRRAFPAFMLLGTALRRSAPLLRWGGAVAGASGAAAIILVAFAAISGANSTTVEPSADPRDAAASVTATARSGEPTSSTTPTVFATVAFAPSPGPMADSLANAGYSLLVVDGCTSCDGPPSRVLRVSLVSLDATQLAASPSPAPAPQLSGAVASPGGDVYVTWCNSGYCGGLGAASADSTTRVDRVVSDGSLETFAEASFGSYPIAATNAGRFLAIFWPGNNPELRWLDTGEVVEPPAWAFTEGFRQPVVLGDGRLAWRDGSLLRWSDGSVFLDANSCTDAAGVGQLGNVVESPSGISLAVQWREPGTPDGQTSVGLFEREGEMARCMRTVPLNAQASIEAWVVDDVLVGSAPDPASARDSGSPAVISLVDGDVELLHFPDDVNVRGLIAVVP